MDDIRIRFELNKGRLGAPLDKLAAVAEEAEKALRMLARDLDIQARKGEWLAVNFGNGSVSFDALLSTAPTPSEALIYQREVRQITRFMPDREPYRGRARTATIAQFARIGQAIDPDEEIGIGFYNGDGTTPEWTTFSHRQALRILAAIEAPLQGYGSVQGIIHALYKESQPPYFQMRELSTGELIKCHFLNDLYPDVWRALKDPHAVVIIGGSLSYNRIERTVSEVRVEQIEGTRPLTKEEFDSFFGAAPDYTGDLTTPDFIEAFWNESD